MSGIGAHNLTHAMNDNYDLIIPLELESTNAVKLGPFNEDRFSSEPQPTATSDPEKEPREYPSSPDQQKEADFSEILGDSYDPVHSDTSNDGAVAHAQQADFRVLGFAVAEGDENAEVDALQALLPPNQRWFFGRYMVIPSGHLSIDAGSWICIGLAVRHGKLYRQGWDLVEIHRDSDRQLMLPKVSPERFCSLIESFGYRVMAHRTDKNGAPRLKIARLSIQMAKQMVNTSAARELPPRIQTIVRCPAVTVDADGKPAYLRQGFNKGQGTFVSDPIVPDRVPVQEAAEALRHLLSDFHFRKPGDFARALAWLLTPALWLGGLLRDARLPFFLAEADRSQSGKTLLVGGIAAVYGEELTTFAQRKHGVGGTGEFFCSALVKAKPFVLFDNIRWELDCPEIEAFFTAPSGRFSARVPHRDSIEIDTRRYFVFGTSNGFKSGQEDLRNRTSIVQLIQRPKGYCFRYSRDRWLAHIRARQAFYLGCVCSVAAAWVEAGRPSTGNTGHHLREWCQALDWILLTYFKHASVGGITDDEVSRMGGELTENTEEDDGDPLSPIFCGNPTI